MKPGATTLFVFDDDAARAAVREARGLRWTQVSSRFCYRLLIEGVRGRRVREGKPTPQD